MSTYRKPNRQEFSFDFQWKGRRFSGNTGCTNKRDADRFEAARREEVKQTAAVYGHGEDMTFHAAVTRYWNEVAIHKSRPDEADRDYGWLIQHVGKGTLLTAISGSVVANLVAQKRGEGVSNTTVNRYVVERLRAVLRRAEMVWEAPVRKISWRDLVLAEPRIRIREMSASEEDLVMANITPRYIPVIEFVVLSGFRLDEAVSLRWRDIDWHANTIAVRGKGDKPAFIPLSNLLRGLLWPMPRTSETVFGVTYSGVKSAWRRCRDKSKIVDLKFHDLRHTCATRSLRNGMDIRLVKDLLRHEDITTTMRYAHVTMDDLRRAMDATSADATNSNRRRMGE